MNQRGDECELARTASGGIVAWVKNLALRDMSKSPKSDRFMYLPVWQRLQTSVQWCCPILNV